MDVERRHAFAPSNAPSVSDFLARCPLEVNPAVLHSDSRGPAAGSSYFYAHPLEAVDGWEAALTDGPRVGFVHYDLGWSWMPKPRLPRPPPLGGPAARSFRYAAWYVRYPSGEGAIECRAEPEGRRGADRLRALLDRPASFAAGATGPLTPGIAESAYKDRIRTLKAAIGDGELYQANFTYPLLGTFRGDLRAPFLRLTARGAAPYSAFVTVDTDHVLVSASPECLLACRNRTVKTYPIKGTRPRSPDPIQDAAWARELVHSDKDRAEHLMIVDLLRNDLGRVVQVGSVEATPLYVESFPTVHHLTTEVRARVPEGLDRSRLWQALFPGGSITGAPKQRAMEWIDGLEMGGRGIYTGSIIHVDAAGDLTANIAIRTAEIREGQVRFGVGGGIVMDSEPDAEWEETRVKSAALGAALQG